METQMDEYARVLQRIEEAKKEKFNLLIPPVQIERSTDSLFVPILETVLISTDIHNGKEIYKGSDKNKYRLHATALKKIANAGAIRWVSHQCGFVKAADRASIAFRASGAILKADGTLYGADGYYDMDFDVIRQNLVEQYDKKAMDWDNKKDYGWWHKKDGAGKKTYLASCIARDLRQKKQFSVQMCETGARSRVIRELFQVKSEYSMEELERPFLVLRFKVNMNYQDPETVRIIKTEAIRSALGLFGPSNALPAPAPIEAEFTPIDATQDPHLGGYADPDAPVSNGKPEPAKPEMSRAQADFEALESSERMGMLKDLAGKKGQDWNALKKNHPEWGQRDFFKFLNELPDPDEIPF